MLCPQRLDAAPQQGAARLKNATTRRQLTGVLSQSIRDAPEELAPGTHRKDLRPGRGRAGSTSAGVIRVSSRRRDQVHEMLSSVGTDLRQRKGQAAGSAGRPVMAR